MGEPAAALHLLSQHPWFKAAEEHLPALAGRLRPRSWEAGQTIFQRRDKADSLIILASGLVRLSLITEEGREVTVRMAATGEAFGELGLLDGSPRSTDATTITKVTGYVLSHSELWDLLERSSGFRKAVIVGLCQRLRDTTAQLESIALMSVEQRVARILHHLACESRKGSQRKVEIALPFSQSELASLAGATRPKVNQALSQLLDDGVLSKTSKGYVCDVALLGGDKASKQSADAGVGGQARHDDPRNP